MESIFESTFKKYTNITLEGIIKKRNVLTDEQNLALKNLYILLRDLLENIYSEARCEKINSKNCENKFPTFLQSYVPKNPYITSYNSETLKIQLPKSTIKCLPDLSEELSLKIVTKDKPILNSGKGEIAKAGLDRNDKDNSVKALYIRIDCLFDDLNEIKAQLQHELQHIAIKSNVSGLKKGNDKFHAFIEYLGDEGEISAYAKEYAYRYYKKYPRDTQLSIDKLKKLFNGQKSQSFNHYMLFGEDSDVIRNKHEVSNADIKKMKRIHDEFVEVVKSSLNYFL